MRKPPLHQFDSAGGTVFILLSLFRWQDGSTEGLTGFDTAALRQMIYDCEYYPDMGKYR